MYICLQTLTLPVTFDIYNLEYSYFVCIFLVPTSWWWQQHWLHLDLVLEPVPPYDPAKGTVFHKHMYFCCIILVAPSFQLLKTLLYTPLNNSYLFSHGRGWHLQTHHHFRCLQEQKRLVKKWPKVRNMKSLTWPFCLYLCMLYSLVTFLFIFMLALLISEQFEC